MKDNLNDCYSKKRLKFTTPKLRRITLEILTIKLGRCPPAQLNLWFGAFTMPRLAASLLGWVRFSWAFIQSNIILLILGWTHDSIISRNIKFIKLKHILYVWYVGNLHVILIFIYVFIVDILKIFILYCIETYINFGFLRQTCLLAITKCTSISFAIHFIPFT